VKSKRIVRFAFLIVLLRTHLLGCDASLGGWVPTFFLDRWVLEGEDTISLKTLIFSIYAVGHACSWKCYVYKISI
jgi:hypothetical protein